MKRCPECRRDYYDDSLLYCLDDGTRLLEGPGSGQGEKREASTILMSGEGNEMPTIALEPSAPYLAGSGKLSERADGLLSSRVLWLGAIGFVLLVAFAVAYTIYVRSTKPALQGNFNSVGS